MYKYQLTAWELLALDKAIMKLIASGECESNSIKMLQMKIKWANKMECQSDHNIDDYR